MFRAVSLIVLTIGAAILHGGLSHRWSANEDWEASIQLMDHFPIQTGDWNFANSRELTDHVVKELGVVKYRGGTFHDASNLPPVDFILMLGRSGPLIRHPPDICYTGRANKLLSTRMLEVETSAQQNLRFKALRFSSTDPSMPFFHVVVGFSNGERWDSPKHPRIAYGGGKTLFKMQLRMDEFGGIEQSQERLKELLTSLLCETDLPLTK